MADTLAKTEKRRRALRRLLYAALGALSFFVVFGFRPLDVGCDAWVLTGFPEWDITQNYAGWLAYRDAPWSWPLTYNPLLCWPEGTVLAYTDTSPILFLVLKLFAPVLPATFQPFGWFTLGFYTLQGLAAGMLVELYTQKLWQLVPGVLLFTFSPIMMERAFRHVSLSAHFVLIFALYYYCSMRRQAYARWPWQFILLGVLSIGLTPYYLPLVFALLAAAAIESWRAGKGILKPLGFIGLNAAVSLLAGWLIGVIGFGGATYSRAGYGDFSMNLNAPFNPSSMGGYRWSALIPEQTQLTHQYDGFNYLGLGVLVFLAVVAVHWLAGVKKQGGPFVKTAWAGAWRFVRRHAPLLVVCSLLTVFAVTNKVSFTGRYMIEIPIPDAIEDLCGIFRASARMFYLPYYLIMLFVLRYLAQKLAPRPATALLWVMMAIQIGDMHGAIGQKHRFFTQPQPQTYANDPVITEALAENDYLICAGRVFEKRILVPAAKNGVATNMRAVNSGSYPGAKALEQSSYNDLLAGRFAENTVYMLEEQEKIAAVQAALAGNENVRLYEVYEALRDTRYLFVIPADQSN